MASIAVTFDGRQLARAIDELADKAPKAIARAINRSVTSTRAVLARDIAADLGLKVGAVKDKLLIREANPNALEARISVSGKPIPLIAFKARWNRKSGVRTNLGPPGQGTYPNAFIATVRTKGAVEDRAFHDGHDGVFQRVTRGKGSKRLPIKELHGPSLPKVFATLTPKALAHAEVELEKNLAHEIDFALKQSAQ